MRNLILILVSSLHIGNFALSQSTLSVNNIIEAINLREYQVDLESESIDYESYPFGVIELESIEDYSVYYIVEKQVVDLEISMGIQSGFKLILYSHNLSKGLLLSFSRSHSIQHKQNDYYVLDFHTNEDLILPEKQIIDKLLNKIELVRINYIDDIPSDTFTLFEFDTVKENKFSIKEHYCEIELGSLFELMGVKSDN